MAESRIELTDELLGAYADGELDAPERERIEHLLALDPGARRRLGAIREVTLLVRAAAGEGRSGQWQPRVAGPQARDHVDAAGAIHGARRARGRRTLPGARGWLDWRVAASFAAGVLVVLGVLELGGGVEGPAGDWHESALAFHDMYLRARANEPPDTMLDILKNQPDSLAQLIDFSPSMPDLARHGYEPTGAHLIAGPQGPILYVVFESPEGPPVGFAMTRRSAGDSGDEAPVVRARRGATLVSWSAGAFEYGLGGRLPESELMPLADTARRSLPADVL